MGTELDRRTVYEQFTDSRPLVQFYKGSRAAIDKIENVEDGRLFFATDTKQIMLDCNFIDSESNSYNKRITFGGSTGIHYANRTFSEEEIAADMYIFNLLDGHLGEDVIELPDIDDLILNTRDGSFYRVIRRDESEQSVEATKLTISGSGSGGGGTGGGPGYISRVLLTEKTLYATNTSTNIPVEYTCYSTNEGASINATVYVGTHSAKTQVDFFPEVSQTERNKINIADYMKNLKLNASNTITIQLTDDYGATISVSCTVYVYDMYVTLIGTDMILPQENDYSFQVCPYGGVELANRSLVFELRQTGSESIVWKNVAPTQADKGTKYTQIVPKQEHGEYTLTVYLQGQIPKTENYLTSPSLTMEIPFCSSSASSPLITATSGIESATQYDRVVISYMVTYGATNTSYVKLLAKYDEGTGIVKVVSEAVVEINNKEFYDWPIVLDKVGTYYLQIIYLDSNQNETDYVKTLTPIIVASFDDNEKVPTIDTEDSSLMIYFNANNRSNNDINKDTWVSNYRGGKVEAKFSNFNWNTNGWKNTADGFSLHLTNGARVEIPYSPFAADSNGLGAENLGRTIEIDFKISNVRDELTPGIQCRSYYTVEENGVEEEITNVGFQIYGNKSQMNSAQVKSKITDMSGWTTMFKADTRIHLTYVINSVNDTPQRIFYTYLDGVVSSLSSYTETDQFIDLSNTDAASKFIFDSSAMDIDIYSVRVYQQSLRPNDVLRNCIADCGSAVEWKQNDVLITFDDQTTGIDLETVTELGNIPYMVFYDGRETGSKKDEGWNDPDYEDGLYPPNDDSRLPTSKKDFRHMEMYYVDPIRGEKYNIGTPESPVIVTCYAQGTSSMEYPIKNLRIYFRKNDDGNHPNQIAKYSLEDGLPAVNLFCLKADYMESASAHNTGTANMLNELYESIGLESPAAKAFPDDHIVTAIVGHPIICFYKPYKANGEYADRYQFIGRYNFNLDKATHEVFGFESEMEAYGDAKKPWGYLQNTDGTLREGFNSALEFTDGVTYYSKPSLDSEPIIFNQTTEEAREKAFEARAKQGPLYEYKTVEDGVTCVQCWEFLNNTSPLVGFRESWDEEIDKVEVSHKDNTGKTIIDHAAYASWTGAFESRFPEHTDEASSDKRTLSRMINWVASTNRHPKIVENDLIAKGIEATPEVIEAEREARLTKFKNEFDRYFIPDFVAFYYVITEFLLMIDSRAKNMMMACFDADPENNSGHWMPIFYDMDTMLGVDNSGNLRFPYSQEDTQLDTFNASGTYDATQYSVLWCNYREAFFSDIKAMYHKLRKGGSFNYSRILKAYNADQANAWQEVYINEDANTKYINPLVSGYESWFDPDGNLITEEEAETTEGAYKKSAADYLYAAQGTRSQHRSYWLEKRFNYLDSKYNYSQEVLGSAAGSGLNFRLNSDLAQGDGKPPFSGDFDFISLADQYVTVDYAQGNIVGPVRVYANTPLHVTSPFTTSTDQEMYIYGLDDIVELGDLSTKYFNKFQLNRATKLRKLILGSKEGTFANPNLGTANVFSLGAKGANVPFLEELNIENCSGITGALDLSDCPYLQNVYASGSSITGVNFFPGGNIKHIELPSTTTELVLNGQLFFDTKNNPDNLKLDSYIRLAKLFISNCPEVNSKILFEKTIYTNKDGKLATYLQNIRLDDLHWTFEADECTVADGVLTEIPLLDVLIGMNGLTTDIKTVPRGTMNNDYLSGTIVIKNGDQFGVNELVLYNKYGLLFPNLHFEYDANDLNTKAYSININNSQSQILYAYSKKLEQTNISKQNETLEDWFTPVVLSYNEVTDEVTGETSLVPKIYDEEKHLLPFSKQSSSQYIYEFKGWSLDKPYDFSEKNYTNNEDREKVIDAVLAIKVSYVIDEEGKYTYSAEKVNNFELTLSAFNANQEINFYPVYAADLNSHIVRFYDGMHEEPIKVERVKYGQSATPPPNPQKLELPENDKTVAYSYPFVGYNLPYDNIVMELNTIAQYGTKKKLSDMKGDEISRDYFYITSNGETQPYLRDNEITIAIKKEFADEAIVIPSTFNGLVVGSIRTDAIGDIPSNLRRIFFESPNSIRAIGNNFMYQQSQLEYCDLPALTQLEYIGVQAFEAATDPNALGVYLTELVLPSLPDSVICIKDGAFRGCEKITIATLSTALSTLGAGAFTRCVGITELDINHTELTHIADNVFANCHNLTIVGETIDCLIEEIGASSFDYCNSLVLNFNDPDQVNRLKKVGYCGFGHTPKLNLENFPSSIEEIGLQAFGGNNNLQGNILSCNTIPRSVKRLEGYVFMFRKLAEENKGILIIENPNISIHPQAFKNFSGVKEIWVPVSVNLTYKPSQAEIDAGVTDWTDPSCFGCADNSPGVIIKHNPN